MKSINLMLTIEEVNTILESLGHMPYVNVKDLVIKIQQQGTSQLQETETVDDAVES